MLMHRLYFFPYVHEMTWKLLHITNDSNNVVYEMIIWTYVWNKYSVHVTYQIVS